MLSAILSVLLALIGITSADVEVMFEWKTINIDWPSEKIYNETLSNNGFIPENNPITGLKIWKEKLFITVPRLTTGVPVTLGIVTDQLSKWTNTTSPKIRAYPSWDMQTAGNCSAFQFVQSMEIDPAGRMWLLDSGIVGLFSNAPQANCPPRLIILDIENNGKIMKTIEFPADVASPNTSYLNDIVLDHTDGGMAYITDADAKDPGIIVYSLKEDRVWKVRHDSMKPQIAAVVFVVAGTLVTFPLAVDGIALSPVDAPERLLYYSPVSSYHMYAIPTSVLKNHTDDISNFIQDLGVKKSQSDGMSMTCTGQLIYGHLSENSIVMWNTSTDLTSGEEIIYTNDELNQWPDTFTYDKHGQYIFWTSDRLQNIIDNIVGDMVGGYIGNIASYIVKRILNDKSDVNQVNYRVLRKPINMKSYQFHADGAIPNLPKII